MCRFLKSGRNQREEKQEEHQGRRGQTVAEQ